MDKISKTVKLFLQENCKDTTPLLLALSGGPDSLLLFYVLKELNVNFIAAHIDHGWRQESKEEAQVLSELCLQFNIPFFCKTLDPKNIKRNLEEACRIERYRYFKQLISELGCQAVVLGHHANDQAETVLKRLFEGGSLPFLTGITPVSTLHGITQWRPLLTVSKIEILKWLQERNIIPFNDPTNDNVHFLRARCRQTIIPLLNEKFEKNVQEPLRNIANESFELQNYLDKKVAHHINNTIQSDFGSLLNLQENCPSEKLELKHLIRRFCHAHELVISQKIVEDLTDLIESNAANKYKTMGQHRFYVDRRRLFLLKCEPKPFLLSQELIHGIQHTSDWKISVEESSEIYKTTDWSSFWKNEAIVSLPKGEYVLADSKPGMPYKGSITLDKWWTDHKVPAMLRDKIPVIMSKDKVVHEFLTGKCLEEVDQEGIVIKLAFTPKRIKDKR